MDDSQTIWLQLLAVAISVFSGWAGYRRWIKSTISHRHDKIRRELLTKFVADQHWTISKRPNSSARWWAGEWTDPKVAQWEDTFWAKSGNVEIGPVIAVAGEVDGRPIVLGYGQAVTTGDENSATIYTTYWKMTLSGAVDGWARLRWAKSEYKGSFRPTDIESAAFNQEFDIHAYPKELAFHLFAPDFLDWYSRSAVRPWVHVRKNELLVVYEQFGQEMDLLSELEQVKKIFHAISKSGALH